MPAPSPRVAGGLALLLPLLLPLVGCGDPPTTSASEGSSVSATTGPTSGGEASSAGGSSEASGGSASGGSTSASTSSGGEVTGSTSSSETSGARPDPCETGTTGSDGDEPPDDHGFATIPPQMALADTFYTYDLRTNIGECATDRVWWSFDAGPAGARLEVPGTMIALAPGESIQYDAGGPGREAVKIAWPIADDDALACEGFQVRWRAWLDCGLLDEGAWGPTLTQAWSVAVRRNHWYSGDLHVHTRHSERGPEAGGVADYVARMTNAVQSDAGQDFADRRRRSLRGRLHWLIFSDHTNNEEEECGRHFPGWCAMGDGVEVATGRDVVRHFTEASGGELLLVVGSEISNKFDGHFGLLPRNPFPGHPLYAPGYDEAATEYDHDFGYGPGIFRERWVDPAATNAEEIAQIHAMQGLAIVNHETGPAFWVTYDWTSLDFDGLEVWNGGNRHDSYDDSAYNGGLDLNKVAKGNLLSAAIPEDPIERSYLGMLKTGRWPLILVGGSDVHDYNEVVCFDGPCDPTDAELATPTTSIWADTFVWANGIDGVADAIARGRAVVHDLSNFIDLRVSAGGVERIVGDTIDGYVPGEPLDLRAFGRVADFVDGDNRVLLILGTNGDLADPQVDVLYSSEDDDHFVTWLKGKDHMRYIRPDSSFDRRVGASIPAERFGASDAYFIWAQFIPWHNPIYLVGNGQDMALTGAIRVLRR
ncbi:MAG: hypothetical protein H6711_17330 [Myxococcales bacterium]|nr:hypothetical protein [Myxococcales bacterium]